MTWILGLPGSMERTCQPPGKPIISGPFCLGKPWKGVPGALMPLLVDPFVDSGPITQN